MEPFHRELQALEVGARRAVVSVLVAQATSLPFGFGG